LAIRALRAPRLKLAKPEPGISRARRYCSPSQRLPPSGLILIFDSSSLSSLRDILPCTLIVAVEQPLKAATIERHRIGIGSHLANNAISEYSKNNNAFVQTASNIIVVHSIRCYQVSIPPSVATKTIKTPQLSPGKDTDTLCSHPRQRNPTLSRRRVATSEALMVLWSAISNT